MSDRASYFFYTLIVIMMVYYIYVTNKPKLMTCQVVDRFTQNCVVTNYLGKTK